MYETDKDSFLFLVKRFLSWRFSDKNFNPDGETFHSPGFKTIGDRTYLMYFLGRRKNPWKMCSGKDLEDCIRCSILYMEMFTGTKTPEELELFLSSEGF